MKVYFYICIALFSVASFSQIVNKKAPYFAKTFDLGSSVTLIVNNEQFAFISRYRELSWNMNAKMSVSKRFSIGLQLVLIFTKSTKGGIRKKENFNFYGAFIQGKVFQIKKYEFFLESSFNRSDMLQQFNDVPLKKLTT